MYSAQTRPTLTQVNAIISMATFVDLTGGHKLSRPKTQIALNLLLKNNLYTVRGPAILQDNLTLPEASNIIDSLKRDDDDEAFSVLADHIRFKYPEIVAALEVKHDRASTTGQ